MKVRGLNPCVGEYLLYLWKERNSHQPEENTIKQDKKMNINAGIFSVQLNGERLYLWIHWMQFSSTTETTISIKQNTGMNIRAGIFSVQQKTLVISFRRKALYEYIESSIFKAVIFFYYPQGSKFEQILI